MLSYEQDEDKVVVQALDSSLPSFSVSKDFNSEHIILTESLVIYILS